MLVGRFCLSVNRSQRLPYWRFFYHLVWATQSRLPLIGDQEETLIRRSLELTIVDLDLIPHAVGTMPDHVHVVVSIPPKIAVAEVLKRMKGASSHAVNQAERLPDSSRFGWQSEYGALTFGEKALASVINYVRHQAERHATNKTWPQLERIEPERSTPPAALARR